MLTSICTLGVVLGIILTSAGLFNLAGAMMSDVGYPDTRAGRAASVGGLAIIATCVAGLIFL